MNCPNCGTYNPEDREICWRCDKELPKPIPPKKKDPRKGAQTYIWIALLLLVVMMAVQMCGLPGAYDPQQEQGPPTGVVSAPAQQVCLLRGGFR